MLISSPPRVPCSTSHSSPVVGMQRRGLDVAVAERPDLRPHAVLADERVVLRDRAVGVDADDLAEQAVHLLRLHAALGDRALALRDEQRAVAAEHQPAAEVQRRFERRRLVIDHLHVLDARRGAVDELAARDGGVVRAVRRAARRSSSRSAGSTRSSGSSATSSRPPWPRARPPAGRRPAPTACRRRDDAQPAGLLGHEHLAAGQERQAPGVLEPLGDGDDVEGDVLLGFGRARLAGERRRLVRRVRRTRVDARLRCLRGPRAGA